MSKRFVTHSMEETLQLGRTFGLSLKNIPQVVALIGDLGAGKTCFSKGVIQELTSISPDQIASPTFTIVEEYVGSRKIYHIDFYRLENESQLQDIPWREFFQENAITLIEWPEKAPEVLDRCHYQIHFSKTNAPHQREISIKETSWKK